MGEDDGEVETEGGTTGGGNDGRMLRYTEHTHALCFFLLVVVLLGI